MRKQQMNIGSYEGFVGFDIEQSELLSGEEERALLRELIECKAKLAGALPRTEAAVSLEEATPQLVSRNIADYYASLSQDAPRQARLGALFHRYTEIRGKLALANIRLVAHVAKRFRDRGIAQADLLQEGLCGLLEAIDRFELSHGTKLATYATWWIRQSIQRLVASTAYPVRLSPRHLRQLAQNQQGLDGNQDGTPNSGNGNREIRGEVSHELVEHIHTATRPTVSLDASVDQSSRFTLLQTMSDTEPDIGKDVDLGESITRLMAALRPREQLVLAMRFGLEGRQRMSLSQVGRVLAVSKERVRQIQDRALLKLRGVCHDDSE